VRFITAEVDNGLVTLEGQVESDDVRDNLTQFTRRIEGVRLVLNRMKTDAQVLSGWQLAAQGVENIWQVISREWLLVLIALAEVVAFLSLARLFGAYSETLLSPFISNVMLRSIAGSFISSLLVITGLMLGLSVLNLTHLVLSLISVAGVVGLSIGFAFRDITEDFIASILLGFRRPFRIGDYIQVAGQAGVVKTLNTHATVLVTLEGNHVRIPNNIVYKELSESKFPTGWDAKRVKRLIDYYEGRSEDEQVAEDDAAVAEQEGQAVITVPEELLPAIRQLLATHKSA
jgi:hypothetical protein